MKKDKNTIEVLSGNGAQGEPATAFSVAHETPAHEIKWSELTYRTFPEATNEWLRCQIGRMTYETRMVPEHPPSQELPRPRLRAASVEIFELIGFGATMDAANAMVEQKYGNGADK